METLAALRQGHGIPAGKKVLIVLDQFEQWLHAKKDEPDTELVRALRQCDGARVQCVVMVRDDFLRWRRDAVYAGIGSPLAGRSEFSGGRSVSDQACEKVLVAFGQAYQVLPEGAVEPSPEQKQFVEQSHRRSRSRGGKVISVRLSLFAEMMKGKPWTPASLKAMGGRKVSAWRSWRRRSPPPVRPPQHRYPPKGRSCRPESRCSPKRGRTSRGTCVPATIFWPRPGMRHARKTSTTCCGCRRRNPVDFPDRSEGKTNPDGSVHDSASSLPAGVRHYQLTHDYLVPALRDWLTRETAGDDARPRRTAPRRAGGDVGRRVPASGIFPRGMKTCAFGADETVHSHGTGTPMLRRRGGFMRRAGDSVCAWPL